MARVVAKRNTATNAEAQYWDFSQDELGIPEDIKFNFIKAWKLFSDYFLQLIKANLQVTTNKFPGLNNFFQPIFKTDNIVNPTSVLGCEFEILLVLNSKHSIHTATDGKEVDVWQTPAKDIVVLQPMIASIMKDCEETSRFIQNSNHPSASTWRVLPTNDQPRGLFAFTFQHDQFTIKVFPVLQLIASSGFLRLVDNQATLEEWPDMDHELSIHNDMYPGFYELIKFCKVLLWEWNNKKTLNASARIPAISIDAIVLRICNQKDMAASWKKMTFDSLCDKVLSDLETAVKQQELKVHCRNLLHQFSKENVEAFALWVQNIKAIPKIDNNCSLLVFIQKYWQQIMQGKNNDNSSVPNNNVNVAHANNNNTLETTKSLQMDITQTNNNTLEPVNFGRQSDNGKNNMSIIFMLLVKTPIVEGKNANDEEIQQKHPGEEEYQQGMIFYRKFNYHEALPFFEKAASLKYPPAFIRLKTIFEEWNDSERAKIAHDQCTEYAPWFVEQIQGGDMNAELNLAVYYDQISKDYKQSFYWWNKMAQKGHLIAQLNLGNCYHGEGVEKDLSQAIYWYQKAADQGNIRAQLNLGTCFYYGKGVKKDLSQAIYWYQKAADQGYADAQCSLGYCYNFGVEKDLSRAVYWYQKAAAQGYVDAQYNLGYCYNFGEGVEKDLSQAVHWYQKAADQGNADAQYNLGVGYNYGEGIEKDLSQAVYWYQKAANQGNADAQYNLGYCYQAGEGVEKDLSQAVYWYQKAADQGNVRAQYNLGVCYTFGAGVAQDYEKAAHWYKKGAEQNHPHSMYWYGKSLELGRGVAQNYTAAAVWYKKAAEMGNEGAQESFDRVQRKTLMKTSTTKY